MKKKNNEKNDKKIDYLKLFHYINIFQKKIHLYIFLNILLISTMNSNIIINMYIIEILLYTVLFYTRNIFCL